MKEPYGEGLAIHTDPESCVVGREGEDEALTGAHAGAVLSREILSGGPTPSARAEGNIGRCAYGKRLPAPAWSETRRMHGNTLRENREVLRPATPDGGVVRSGKPKGAIR